MASTRAVMRLRVQPAVASRVMELLVRREPVGLSQLVEADPALCAIVVRAANSAHLGLSRRVGGIRQAMVLLGQEATTALAVARTADLILDEDPAQLPPSWLWPHAVATATAAAGLARSSDVSAEHAYTAGLVADLGVLFDGRHEADCSDRGADALASWNFPDPIVQAVRNHHKPLDELIAPLDLILVGARKLATDAGCGDGKPVPSARDVSRLLDVNRAQVRSIGTDIERAIASLVRLAGRR